MKKYVILKMLIFTCVILMFNTASAQWPDVKISDSGNDPAIAVDTSGEVDIVHIVYSASLGKGKKNSAQKLLYVRGENNVFSSPVRVTDTPNGQAETSPRIEVHEDGIHICFYLQESDDFHSLYYGLFTNTPANITNIYPNISGSPSNSNYMDVDNDGYVHILRDGSDIYYLHNKSGDFETINVTNGIVDFTANIYVDQTNIAHIVFGQGKIGGGGYDVYYTHNITAYSNEFAPAVCTNPDELDFSYIHPAIIVDDSYIHITYLRHSFEPGTRADCYYSRLDRSALTPPASINDIVQVSIQTDDNSIPKQLGLTTTDMGSVVHIIWPGRYTELCTYSFEIYYSTVNSQLVVSHAEKVTMNNVRDLWSSMAMGSDGRIHVTCIRDRYEVWYANNASVPTPGKLHVAGIDVITQTSKNKVKGVATVFIADENNNPVAGATVSGYWSELTNDSDIFLTGSDGSGRANSDQVSKKSSGLFTFTVTDVSVPNWIYDPDEYDETSDSAPWNTMGKGLVDDWQTVMPKTTELLGNYPNPFNPSTTISFQLATPSPVILKIYNNLGQEVRTLVNSLFETGNHSISWDGRNNIGKQVLSGVYLYRIQAGEFSDMKKLMLIR